MKSIKHKKQVITILIIVAVMGLSGLSSCKKQDNFLNVKRLNSDVTPSTLQDFQAVLDNNSVMNSIYPAIGLQGTDNSYLTDATLNTATSTARNAYIWAKDIFQGQASTDWTSAYQIVEYTNIVLDGLQKIKVDPTNQAQFNQIKGSALFYRSLAFYGLAQLFSPPYNASTAGNDLGIPVRLNSDVNIPSVRSSVQQTYSQILGDLQIAKTLLPVVPMYSTRPSLVSASALLAKIYLDMGDYNNAGIYANTALELNGTLLDYNSSLVSKTSTYHFPTFTVGNPEIIFYAYTVSYPTLRPNGTGNVDAALYNAYDDNDLRKSLFYLNKGVNNIHFVGGYVGTLNMFGGIANNEIYLIRAECYARNGNTSAAMTDLNTLLRKRWKTGTFIPFTASGSTDALTQILKERRKELPFTGLIRWTDLRRLNNDPRFAVTITHAYNGTTYTLAPNDRKYVYPIPDLEIQQYGLPQNLR